MRPGRRGRCTSASPSRSTTRRRSGPSRPTSACAASNPPSTPTTSSAQTTPSRARTTYERSPMSSHITTLLDRNRAFAATDTRTHAPRLPFLPHQELYVITCIDPQVDPAQFLGLQLRRRDRCRTVGGRATAAVIQDLSYIGYLVEEEVARGSLLRGRDHPPHRLRQRPARRPPAAPRIRAAHRLRRGHPGRAPGVLDPGRNGPRRRRTRPVRSADLTANHRVRPRLRRRDRASSPRSSSQYRRRPGYRNDCRRRNHA